MQYRHEMKHQINNADLLVIKPRLDAVMRPDSNAKDGLYKIRSLYFDNIYDKALREKLNGKANRDKYRIRYYSESLGPDGMPVSIKLEKKSKRRNLGTKESCPISAEEVRKLLEGDYSWMLDSGRDLIVDLYIAMIFDCIRPKSIVDYTRRPYVYDPGNVRVTFDYDIRTTTNVDDFLNMESPSIPVQGNPIIMEVKWDDFLPDIIKDCVQIAGRSTGAYSKYAASRMYD